MSLDHIYQENLDQIEGENDKQQKEFYEYQMQEMYDEKKYVNPHDIAGTKGLVNVQNEELNIKKVQFRMNNELYLRKHPELNTLISVFLFKVLEDKPQNILAYAGKFFDQDKLKEIIEIEKKHYMGSQ